LAQTVPIFQVVPDTTKMTYNQIAQTMKLYVFPTNGQTQQKLKSKWKMTIKKLFLSV